MQAHPDPPKSRDQAVSATEARFSVNPPCNRLFRKAFPRRAVEEQT